jgi:hypothetical protein
MHAALAAELGTPALDTPVSASRGWTASGWLVAHAQQFGVKSVAFAGQQWAATRGTWQPTAATDTQVRVQMTTGA